MDNKELERQLKHPRGENGLLVSDTMFETNFSMIYNSILALNIERFDDVLEIGHGNAKHVADMFVMEPNFRYTGLDISNVMHELAKDINKDNKRVNFMIYGGLNLPFEDMVFEKIISVNTLYFWEDVEYMLNEMYRVLKPWGKATVCFSHKSYMKHLPFVGDQFTLYDVEDLKRSVDQSQLFMDEIETYEEVVKSKSGQLVDRTYSIVSLTKAP